MSELKIITNRQPRPTLRWWELTEKERAEFDYIDTEAKQDEAEFVRYLGVIYDLHDMDGGWGQIALPQPIKGWDNYRSDSFFSGILVKFVFEDGTYTDQVVMGRYCS